MNRLSNIIFLIYCYDIILYLFQLKIQNNLNLKVIQLIQLNPISALVFQILQLKY